VCSVSGTDGRGDAQVERPYAGAEEFAKDRKLAEDWVAGGEREGCMWELEGRGDDGGKEEGEEKNDKHYTAILVPGVIYVSCFSGTENDDPRLILIEVVLAVQIRQVCSAPCSRFGKYTALDTRRAGFLTRTVDHSNLQWNWPNTPRENTVNTS